MPGLILASIVLALPLIGGCAATDGAGSVAPIPSPVETIPDGVSLNEAIGSGRLEVTTENADRLLALAKDDEERLTILVAAGLAGFWSRDFSAAAGHLVRFKELREAVGGGPDQRDAAFQFALAGVNLATADNEDEVGVARMLAATLPWTFPSMRGDPYAFDLCAAAGADRPWTMFNAYAGRFANDDRFSLGKKRIEAALPGAFEIVRRRLDLPGLEFPPVAIRFQDGKPLADSSWMSTHLHTRAGKPVAVVRVGTEHLIGNFGRESYLLAHELVHALHGETEGAIERPDWLSEGLAHWSSDENDEDLRALALSGEIGDPSTTESRLGDLLGSPVSLALRTREEQRRAGALLFSFIERSRGLDATRLLAIRLFEDDDYGKVFRTVLGATPEQVFEEARRDLPSWFQRFLPKWKDVVTVCELQGQGRNEEAIARFDSLFRRDDRGMEAFRAAIARIFALRDLQRWNEAVSDTRLLQEAPQARFSMPSLKYGELKYLRLEGRWEEVAVIGRAALNDLVWGDRARQAEIVKWVEEAEGKAAESGTGGK